ncbi:MAG TPA: tetratricopeptide repeat protein [Bryobacteraceae bacterium]|nr:tetratricopeptide repeat protein [Bryobacteraceae bacterium]
MDASATGLERLNSWKEIAAHLRVSVRTVQRWEKTEDLPAHRHRHAAADSVFAYRSELDAWWNSRPQLREPAVENLSPASIAVLPFVNLDQDQQGEIFADGLTEELINALTLVQGLQVAARTSSFHFKGKTGDVRAIGARLGVRALLEGSVRRDHDRLRITTQLINASDGCHLWSQRFDRHNEDLFEIQEEIANSIAAAFRGTAVGSRTERFHGSDFESYALYLEGRHHWNKRTRSGIYTAVECFERVLAKQPGMAPAWAGLADCYLMGEYAGITVEEAIRKGRAAAQKALEIDDALAEAHASLAFASAAYDYDWEAAEARFRHALRLNPNCAQAHLLYAALVLGPAGRLEEAIHHQQLACQLDPLSAVMTSAIGTLALMLRHFDEAIAACRRALELDPGYPWAHRWMGEAYLFKKMYEQAEDAFSKIEGPVFAAGFMGYCYARTNRQMQARQLLSMDAMSDPMLSLQVAVLHLGLGEHDLALESLQRACNASAVPGIHWLKIEPVWDVLRTEPQFTRLLQRLRLSA